MELRSITFMRGKAVARIFEIERHHDAVARHFRNDRGGGNRQTTCISPDHCLYGARKFRRAIAVNERQSGRFGKLGQSFRHGPKRCLENVDAIDAVHVCHSDAYRGTGSQRVVQLRAPGRRKQFGIVQSGRDVTGIENHRRGNDRARPRSATGFVNAAHRTLAQQESQ